MVKALAKIVGVAILIGAILFSFGLNALSLLQNRDNGIASQAVANLMYQITETVKKNNEVSIPVLGTDGKQTGAITLIQKTDGAKK